MVTICTTQLGSKRPLLDDWSFSPPPDWRYDGNAPTLRDVITRIVREEVAAFKSRQRQRATFQAMTEVEVQEAARRGAVKPGLEGPEQEVNEDAAIANALQAFEDGIYLIFIDEQEQTSLDRQVFLREDSTIKFVRLVMLAGA